MTKIQINYFLNKKPSIFDIREIWNGLSPEQKTYMAYKYIGLRKSNLFISILNEYVDTENKLEEDIKRFLFRR